MPTNAGDIIRELPEEQRKKVQARAAELTRDFRETVRARAKRDPDFRRALREEAKEQESAGETEVARALIDYTLKKEKRAKPKLPRT